MAPTAGTVLTARIGEVIKSHCHCHCHFVTGCITSCHFRCNPSQMVLTCCICATWQEPNIFKTTVLLHICNQLKFYYVEYYATCQQSKYCICATQFYPVVLHICNIYFVMGCITSCHFLCNPSQMVLTSCICATWSNLTGCICATHQNSTGLHIYATFLLLIGCICMQHNRTLTGYTCATW